jgi:copper(I)-binding protein
VLAAYATLRNNGSHSLTITAADSPDFGSAEFHQMQMANGMMHMQKQDSVVIGAHDAVTLNTGQSHLMLMKPKRPLKAGDKVAITLHCGKAAQSFNFPVQAPSLP